jgi:hypothetical protein
MAIAEKIPSLDDASLVTLRGNAARLSEGAISARQKEAKQLLLVIDAELVERKMKARKPVKAKPGAAPKAGDTTPE